ncbi:type II secretion system protein [Vampirovibrio chlorellavorus]|uniref:type II secretion system protein n=1 Tax=Vampirovibrio chlorellavorus TaxID=758823 RepID=UPI0026F092DA|nr:type II secretion system protein [Vampirovibrio chlorellavorus]
MRLLRYLWPVAQNQAAPTGFTLAELLISLLILAEIATFSIPKILSTQQDARKKAIFKECIATLYELNTKARMDLSANVATPALQRQFFRNNLNYVKECATNPGLEGCLEVGAPYSDPGNASAFVLPNGAVLTSINGPPLPSAESVGIDWNGPAGPNTFGDDIISVTVCYGPSACNGGIGPILMGPTGPGAIGPSGNLESVTLWTEIFN